MGLSRNKVAVPEGAAGTPPFWSVAARMVPGLGRGRQSGAAHHFHSGAVSGPTAVPSVQTDGYTAGGSRSREVWTDLSSLLLRCYGSAIGPQGVGSPAGHKEGPVPSRKQTFIDILIQAEKLRVEQKSKSLMYIDPPFPSAFPVRQSPVRDAAVPGRCLGQEKRQEV